jgi:NAD(P)-dependent dehydrogenase (short-subunit alcohol dehydrogenase family)
LLAIGGSAGIGLATAKQAHLEGANVIIVGRNQQRVETAARETAAIRTAILDVADFAGVQIFLQSLPEPIDHVMLTAGSPYYSRVADIDFDKARRNAEQSLLLPLLIARWALGGIRPGGSITLMGGTGGRKPDAGAMISALTAALSALTRSLAVELAPVRVNLIASGFVDTPLSATLLGDNLEARRQQLRNTLPIGRVVVPEDVAALAIHIMTNTALTGATYDIDGGQQLLS